MDRKQSALVVNHTTRSVYLRNRLGCFTLLTPQTQQCPHFIVLGAALRCILDAAIHSKLGYVTNIPPSSGIDEVGGGTTPHGMGLDMRG